MSNHSLLSLDEKIACLVEDVGDIRVELQKSLATLRDTNNVPGALATTSRIAERLITALFVAAKRKPKSGTMEKLINELVEQSFLPAERATYLHTIRTLANKARHDAEKSTLRAADAETALNGLLVVLEWFFCECECGMKLASVYSIGAPQVITATAAVQRLEAELERLRQELIQQGQRRRELKREPIVGLRFADVSDTFKNRKDKLAELRRLLGDKTVKMVLIVGRGGIGKTALLCKLCEEIERGELCLTDVSDVIGANGIVYVSCRGTDKPTVERLFHDVGRLLGNPHADELNECWKDASRSLTEKLRFLLAKLREGCYLLVLDNLEDVLAPDNTIADSDLRAFVDLCLASPHALRLIATSRERVVLGSSGMRAARTVPLDKGLDEADAIVLLRELDKSGELGLRDAPEEQLRLAAQRTYGIPRAIEKIATLLTDKPMLTLDKLLSEESLFTEQVVENLIAEHYRRMSPEHLRVLEALAVYNKPVPAVAIRYLLHPFFPTLDVDAALHTLVRNYSVTYNRGMDTFDLHPLDRQYTYARIPDDGDYTKQMLHRRAAEFYRQLRKSRSEWKTIEDLQPHINCFYHLIQAEAFFEAALVIDEIDYHYLSLWGYSDSVIAMRKQLVGKLQEAGVEQLNFALLGFAYNRLMQLEDAIACFRQTITIAKMRGDEWYIGDTKGNLGRALMLIGDIDTAVQLFQEAIQCMKKYNNRLYEGLWTGRLGEAYQRLGNRENALQCYKFALEVSELFGEVRWRVAHLSNLGNAYREPGDMLMAIRYLQDGLVLAVETGNRQGEGICSMRLGQVFHYREQLRDARVYYERGWQVKLPPCTFVCPVKLGILCLQEGDIDASRHYFESAVQSCHALLEKTPRLYDALYNLATALLGVGQVDDACATYRQALEVCSAKGVVQSVLQDLRLLQRTPQPPEGLEAAITLLEEAT